MNQHPLESYVCCSFLIKSVDCVQTCHVTHYKIYGCCIVIQYQCLRGHKFVWASSEMSMNKSNNKLFKNNLVFSSAVVLSGLSYYKVSDFAKIIGLSISSSTSFHSYQRHYICPGIQVYFDKEQVLYFFKFLRDILYAIFVDNLSCT